MISRYGEDVCRAWLASPLLPPDTLETLVRSYGTAKAVYEAFCGGENACLEILPDSVRDGLRKNASAQIMDWFESVMRQYNIKTLLYTDKEYPKSLTSISDRPGILFYQGNIGCMKDRRILSMVGSRRASYTGRRAAEATAAELSRHGISIVSGLASGIDTAGHEGCLRGGSPTVAVLGCGLDRTYPAENAALRDRILERGGAVISEFAPGEKPLGWHFPVRNRIISGLGFALILIEARIKSGSLTTVQWALDQGKDVFVFPGEPGQEEYNEGNIQLLREGARLFTKAEHILEDLKWLDNREIEAHNTESLPDVKASSPAEAAVMKALVPGALGLDGLCAITGLSAGEAMGAITLLQMRRMIEALPGKQYQIRRIEQKA